MAVKNTIETFSNYIESVRKIALNLSIFIVVIVISIAIIRHQHKKELLIYPFKVPRVLADKGYTGEILTMKLINRIDSIKGTASDFYKSNNVEVPSWENEIDEFKAAVGEDSYSKINTVLKFLVNSKSQSANGSVINYKKDSLQINFKISGQNDFVTLTNNIKNIDSLILRSAEYVMEKSDPYYLGAWYMKTGQTNKCLEICQRMLNDDDDSNDGLALHLRGSVFLNPKDKKSNIKAIQILSEAVKKMKSPWLTYNNLGVAYFYIGDFKSAAKMYKLSIESNSNTFGGYRNYANLLYQEYLLDNSKVKKLDSAVQFYYKAIQYNKTDVKEYISIIPPLYVQNKIEEANQYYEKAIEMDEKNYLIYYQMGRIQRICKKYPEAIENFKLAYKLCNTDSTKKEITEYIIATRLVSK